MKKKKELCVKGLHIALSSLLSAATQLTKWDWSHLLVDHPDSEEVLKDLKYLEEVIVTIKESMTDGEQ